MIILGNSIHISKGREVLKNCGAASVGEYNG